MAAAKRKAKAGPIPKRMLLSTESMCAGYNSHARVKTCWAFAQLIRSRRHMRAAGLTIDLRTERIGAIRVLPIADGSVMPKLDRCRVRRASRGTLGSANRSDTAGSRLKRASNEACFPQRDCPSRVQQFAVVRNGNLARFSGAMPFSPSLANQHNT